MRTLLLAAVVASLGMPLRALAADKAAPTPAPPPALAAPAVKGAVEATVSKAALDVTRWTERAVDVMIPKGVPPGSYYVGVADARGQWVSAIDQTFEVLPEVRDVAVSLDVTFRCLVDVLAALPAIPITLVSSDGRASVRATLAAAGWSSGDFGRRVYRFAGRVGLRPGRYRAAADPAARFGIQSWDNPPNYYLTTECSARRRVTDRGAPLPAPTAQIRTVPLGDSVTITDDTTSLPLSVTMLIDLGSFEPPTPVCPPGGCT